MCQRNPGRQLRCGRVRGSNVLEGNDKLASRGSALTRGAEGLISGAMVVDRDPGSEVAV